MSKLSVIIPAYNSEATIKRAVRSVLDNIQDSNLVECIVVISSDTDDTLDICRNLQQDYSNLVVIESRGSNVSEARNEGLMAAQGDVIGFCDSDDYFSSDSLELCVEEFLASGADVMVYGFNRVSAEGEIISSHTCPSGDRELNQVRCDLINNPNVMGSMWNKLYSKKVLENIYFDRGLTHCEDTEYNLRVLKSSDLKVRYSDRILYNYVHNPKSLSNDINKVYDASDKLKYLYAMEKIRQEYKDDKVIYKETGLKMATLCIDNYREILSQVRKANLRPIIKSNIKYLVMNITKYEPEVNRYRLRKGIRILMKR